MFKNYMVMAWRQIVKNKLYATINILGLVTGLVIYLFGSILVRYEESHDTFFANSDRIFTAGSIFSPTSGVGVTQNDGVYTAVGPLLREDVPELEAVARTVGREFLVSVDDSHYYEKIKFADPELLKIFDFKYIEGDAGALNDPNGVLLTEDVAHKFFGEGSAIGRTLTLDHDLTLHVTAVIETLPPNTHFNSSIINSDSPFGVVAPLAALDKAVGYDLAGNWNNLSNGDMTYMLFPAGTTRDQVQNRLDGVYEAHYDEGMKEFITGMTARRIDQANTIIWDMIGMPVLESLEILAFLVLVVAIVNYTNLATAQSLGRAREVGLRKTMGASHTQLLIQFLVESVCIVAISMLIALAALEVVVPLFNEATGRGLSLLYLQILPWLVLTTLGVGIVAGAYPAYLITRSRPIEALRESTGKSSSGSLFRSSMLGLQFTISIFMLAMVIVVYAQNQKVISSSNIYPHSQILTLKRLSIDTIQQRLGTLKNELMRIDGIQAVTYSSQVPFEQSNSSFMVSPERGNDEKSFSLMQISVDESFLSTYHIGPMAGRNLTDDISGDTIKEGVLNANILVNESVLERLGYGSAASSVGRTFFDLPESREPRAYTIVGVLPDQNFQGFHHEIKPMVFLQKPENFRIASVRIDAGVPMHRVISDIESVWSELIPEYPIQTQFLDAVFNDVFNIFSLTTKVLGGFAVIALLLSTIGLFGLAAFMAQNRTREIGIRKVMGANLLQIIRLLVWQFSKPVMWSLLIALPLAYFASNTYLDFFADRITGTLAIVSGAGIAAIVFSWLIVAVHAIRIARSNPIHALRYE